MNRILHSLLRCGRDLLAEWLMRLTRNQVGFPRVGSSPAEVDLFFSLFFPLSFSSFPCFLLSPFLLGCFVLRARPGNAETVLFTVFSFCHPLVVGLEPARLARQI